MTVRQREHARLEKVRSTSAKAFLTHSMPPVHHLHSDSFSMNSGDLAKQQNQHSDSGKKPVLCLSFPKHVCCSLGALCLHFCCRSCRGCNKKEKEKTKTTIMMYTQKNGILIFPTGEVASKARWAAGCTYTIEIHIIYIYIYIYIYICMYMYIYAD